MPAEAMHHDDARLLERLRSQPRRVVLAGWYGEANLGDELILSVLARWVEAAGGEPIAISVHPDYTRGAHRIEAVSFVDLAAIVETVAGADLLVLGGGGLFQDYDPFDRASLLRFPALNVSQYAQFFYLAEALGVPTAVLAQGVGPLRGAEGREIVRDVFERAGFVSVRDLESAALLRDTGVGREIRVAPDPAWAWEVEPNAQPSLAARFPQLAGRRVLAMVLRNWPFDPQWENAFVAAFAGLLPEDWACLWIDFHRIPGSAGASGIASEIAERMIARLGRAADHAIWNGSTVDDAGATLAQCDASVAMRLHGVLLSHRAGLPTVALEYDSKVRALGDLLGGADDLRMPLTAIPSKLRPALRRITAADRDRSGGIDPARIAQLARDALDHRALLWQAMSAAQPLIPWVGSSALSRELLAGWTSADGDTERRVVAALSGRLCATRTVAPAPIEATAGTPMEPDR